MSLPVPLLLLLQAAGTLAGAQASPKAAVRVCVLDSSPTVALKQGETLLDGQVVSPAEAGNKMQGIGIDMANVIFDQLLKWNYTVTYYTFATLGFSSILYDVRVGRNCDVAIQSFFVSAKRDLCTTSCPLPPNPAALIKDADYEPYACCIDFSQPFYDGGWTITSRISDGSNIDYLAVFLQRDIVHTICVAAIATFIMSHLIWLVERWGPGRMGAVGDSTSFGGKYLDAVRDGVWFSSNALLNGVVTPEKRIQTPLGRVLVTIWIMFGVFMLAFITSVISSTLTTQQLNAQQILKPTDLAGRRVCLEAGFYNAFFDATFPGIGISKVLVPNLNKCFGELKSGAVDAVFGVRDYTVDYFSQGQGLGLMVSPTIKAQPYGMVWRQSWEYGSAINEALLLFREDVYATTPSYQDSKKRWYAGDASEILYGGKVEGAELEWNYGIVFTALGLTCAYTILQVLVYLGAVLQAKGTVSVDASAAAQAGSQPKKLQRSTTAFLSSMASTLSDRAPSTSIKIRPEAMDSRASPQPNHMPHSSVQMHPDPHMRVDSPLDMYIRSASASSAFAHIRVGSSEAAPKVAP